MYSGSLTTRIHLDEEAIVVALREVRRVYFCHRALYKNINGNGFGKRLRTLIDERSGDHQQTAEKLGVNMSYLTTLMDEPFTVSNPSAKLLRRMSVLLQVSVGYLLGETAESDAVWVESMASWRTWMISTPVDQPSVAFATKDRWKDQYVRERHEPTLISYRSNDAKVIRETDWDRLYREERKKVAADGAQRGLY